MSEWVDRQAFPWQSRWLETGEGRQHYVDVGEGAPIVFVHGTPTWSFEWRHLIRALSATHRCIALDHLGFGLSERPEAAYTPEAHAKRFERFVDALGLERFTLVVHDFGGPIALPFAQAHPGRIERLVVTNSWMWPLQDDPKLAKAARMAGGRLGRFLYRHFNASLKLIMPSAYGDRSKLTPEIHRQYLAPFATGQGRAEVLHALAKALLGSSSHYAALWEGRQALQPVPMLVVWGLADSAFPPRMLARWREAFPAARVVELDGAGHWPHEEQPEAVIEAVRAFLAVEAGRSHA